MMTVSLVSIALIVIVFFTTGAWIGSLNEGDTMKDMLWSGLCYATAGIAVVGLEGLLVT